MGAHLQVIFVREDTVDMVGTTDVADVKPVDWDVLLTPAQVARMLAVDPKTVTRWASADLVSSIRTLGGHRRYRKSEIVALMVDGRHSRRRPGRPPRSRRRRRSW